MPPKRGRGRGGGTATTAAKSKTKGKGKEKEPIEYVPLPAHETEPSFYLAQLNENQRKAVEHEPQGGLQILAGPGSGKTKVLTTRVAHLVKHFHLDPTRIVVVTFTNKAAREMQKRLYALVGPQVATQLVMGTFHALCVQFLRKWRKLVNLPADWSVIDAPASEKLITRVINDLKKVNPKLQIRSQEAKTIISNAKGRNVSADEFAAHMQEGDYGLYGLKEQFMPIIYREYQEKLDTSHALDFDDLLMYGYRLLKNNPEICGRFKAVLIDEFQDTSSLQYDLARILASGSNHLTIVGDPDQSIYGWRQADIENLYKMKRDYKNCSEVHLTHNYRSSASIVGAAKSIIEEDKSRIKKDLVPVHPLGVTVVHAECTDEASESTFIAEQILHLQAHSGGMLKYSDFAILVRFHAQSRGLEAALMRCEITYRVADGARFFDRIEIADILAYLQLINNPHFAPAFERVINVPKRGIGDVTYEHLESAATREKKSLFDIASDIANGRGSVSVNENTPKGLRVFVNLINHLRLEAEQGKSVDELIDAITTTLEYEEYLNREHGNGEDRMRNVGELVRFAGNLQAQHFRSNLDDPDGDVDPSATKVPDAPDATDENVGKTPLSDFLSSLALLNGLETSDAEKGEDVGSVTIATCHSAKGLEWPVVFVPGVESDKYPAFWTNGDPAAEEEERRLLYVAVTRAQAFCFLVSCSSRAIKGIPRPKRVSPFLIAAKTRVGALFSTRLDRVTPDVRATLSKQLGRTIDEAGVQEVLDEYARKRAERASPSRSPSRSAVPASAPPASPTPAQTPAATASQGGSSWSQPSASANSTRPPNRNPSDQAITKPYLSASWSQPRPSPFSASQGSSTPPSASQQSNGFRPARVSLSKAGTSTELVSPGTDGDEPPQSQSQAQSQPPSQPPSQSSAFRPARTSSASSLQHLPETRASLINQPILVNPEPIKPRGDLLASFQTADADSLESMRQLAQGEASQAKPPPSAAPQETNGPAASDINADDRDESVDTTAASGSAAGDDAETIAGSMPKRAVKRKEVYDPSLAKPGTKRTKRK